MSQLLADRPRARDQYLTDGVVQVRGLFGAEEIATIRDTFTAQIESDPSSGWDDNVPDGDILKRYPRFVHPHRRPETPAGEIARRLMTDKRLVDVVTELVGPVYGAQSMFYFKPPTARGQALHQDNLFLQAHPETCIAAWIAVDACDAENGGLMVIPGSHTQQILCPEDADETQSFATITVPVPDGVHPVQTQLDAGDVLFFHGSLVHGSKPNTSAERFRRSLIFHYVPQASTEIATFYQPLVAPDGQTVWIDESADGGACGEGWTNQGH